MMKSRNMGIGIVCVLLIMSSQGMGVAGSRRAANAQRDAARAEMRPRLFVQLGHASRVTSVAFSPDGRFALTGSWDNSARLWEVETGKEIRMFQGHSSWISSVAFSPNERFILTGSYDKTARLWDVMTGSEVQRFEGHSASVLSVAFSPDGKTILTGGDLTARLWDVATGRELRRFEGHKYIVQAVAFSPDGHSLLTGSSEGIAILWAVETGETIRRFREDERIRRSSIGPYRPPGRPDISFVAFSPDGKSIVLGCAGYARLWNATTGDEIRLLEYGSTSSSFAAFSPDGHLVLTSGDKNSVQTWDASTGEKIQLFQSGSDSIECAAISPDGQYVLTGVTYTTSRSGGSEILTLRMDGSSERLESRSAALLWDARTGKEIRRFEGYSDAVLSVAFSPDGQFILTGSHDKIATLWDITSGRELRRFEGHSGAIAAIAISSDERFVLTGSTDKTARLWDAGSGAELKRFQGHTDVINCVAISRDGRFVLTGSGNSLSGFTGIKDTTARLWDTTTGKEIRRFEGHEQPITSVAFSPYGNSILTVSEDRTARLWDSETGREIRQFGEDGGVTSAAFSPDGPYVLTGSGNKTVHSRDLASGNELRRSEFKSSVLVLSSGRFIFSIGDAKTTNHIAISPDGRIILTGASDGTTRLLNGTTGQELCRMVSLRDGNSIVVDPEGRFDTNNLEEIRGLHWMMPDDPMRPLPLEIFMRDYYEPQLLSKIVNVQPIASVRELSGLNRTQPKVEIKRVVPRSDDPDLVMVEVEVSKITSQSQRDQRGQSLQTGVYDLRVFRDGKLVGQWPKRETSGLNLLADYQGLPDWQQASHINLDKTGKQTIPFQVRLPRKADSKQVEFSAYAFNIDRVKSATSKKSFIMPQGRTATKGRAYLISVGVNSYENPAWNLKFAANDARLMRDVLSESLVRVGGYSSVVQILLTSDYRPSDGSITEKGATKANFKTLLDLLSGKPVAPGLIRGIPGANKILKSTPDDLVLISFASHGIYSNNEFFFLPYDIGAGRGKDVTANLLHHSISSDELSLWLRNVDAGEMVLIVDACQSAALVENEGFKPGPMGSRGLGQLAYDKGMRILAATQKDSVALETDELEHGLLTYALVHDGIQARQADTSPQDKKISLSEWLEYGVMRVPALVTEIERGQISDFGLVRGHGKPKIFHTGKRDTGTNTAATQKPALFDFIRKPSSLTLVRLSP